MIADLSSDRYHADQVADQPSLSASIAHILCSSSPAHARANHPRLNPAFKRDDKVHYDVGTAAHAMLLEGRNAVHVIEGYDDWKKPAAREERDAVRASGRVPLLAKVWADVEEMVASTREKLAVHHARPPLFTDGTPEVTIVWQEDGVTCRSRLDWLRDDLAACDDLKTTSRLAEQDAWIRGPMLSTGAYIKAAFYLRGIRAVTGADPEFRWCVVETQPPYELSVIAPAPSVMDLAMAKVEWAIATWRRCMETGDWPGYSREVCYAEMPTWEETRWLEREAREDAA